MYNLFVFHADYFQRDLLWLQIVNNISAFVQYSLHHPEATIRAATV